VNSTIGKLWTFAREAVCPVSDNCVPGFVAGAYWGWGQARNAVERILAADSKPAIPDSAICFFLDGESWCCVNGDFKNLQESPAGFGDHFADALKDLEANRMAVKTSSLGDDYRRAIASLKGEKP
jgi:hypothetical protein